jgi:hypothetical protein
MIFLAGFSLGVLATIGVALIVATDQNTLDEQDNNN